MRIIHLCLSCFYIDNYNYQENLLPRIDLENGNEVLVIASTQALINKVKAGYTSVGEYKTEDGVHVIRIPYVNLGLDFITHKIKKYHGLYKKIEEFQPDIIFSHGLGFDMADIVRYKKKYPYVKLYADTHTAHYNSGKNWISLNILHRIVYKRYIQNVLPYIEKVFYIGISEKDFCVKNYSVPDNKMEYFPLGGIILDKEEYKKLRNDKRLELGIKEDEYLLLHSGKLTAGKKTELLLKAFINSNIRFRAKLLIVGSIPDKRNKEIYSLLNDKRIMYLGWKSAEELKKYLCAADIYIQPGTVSATLQQAICSYCSVICYPYEEYKNINNAYGNLLFCESQEDIQKIFDEIEANKIDMNSIIERTVFCANDLLDYKENVKKYYY